MVYFLRSFSFSFLVRDAKLRAGHDLTRLRFPPDKGICLMLFLVSRLSTEHGQTRTLLFWRGICLILLRISGMKNSELDMDAKYTLAIVANRNALDPKKHYRKEGKKPKVPSLFQVCVREWILGVLICVHANNKSDGKGALKLSKESFLFRVMIRGLTSKVCMMPFLFHTKPWSERKFDFDISVNIVDFHGDIQLFPIQGRLFLRSNHIVSEVIYLSQISLLGILRQTTAREWS